MASVACTWDTQREAENQRAVAAVAPRTRHGARTPKLSQACDICSTEKKTSSERMFSAWMMRRAWLTAKAWGSAIDFGPPVVAPDWMTQDISAGAQWWSGDCAVADVSSRGATLDDGSSAKSLTSTWLDGSPRNACRS